MQVLEQKIKNFGKNRLKKTILTSLKEDVLTIDVKFLEAIDRIRLKTMYKKLFFRENDTIIVISNKKLAKEK